MHNSHNGKKRRQAFTHTYSELHSCGEIIDYSFPEYESREKDREWGDLGKIDWWIKENKLVTWTKIWQKLMLWLRVWSNPINKQWLRCEEHSSISWWEGMGRWRSVRGTTNFYHPCSVLLTSTGQVCWCSNSNMTLTPVIVIGATMSHANQIDMEMKAFTFKVLLLLFTAWFSMLRRRCRKNYIWLWIRWSHNIQCSSVPFGFSLHLFLL